MSWWNKVVDTLEGALGIPTTHEKNLMNEQAFHQMEAYKEQTRLTQGEIDRAREEKSAEKRRIEEKQIRALRRNFRPAGFLNNAQGPATGVGNKLGA